MNVIHHFNGATFNSNHLIRCISEGGRCWSQEILASLYAWHFPPLFSNATSHWPTLQVGAVYFVHLPQICRFI